jgi:hypothetical protein
MALFIPVVVGLKVTATVQVPAGATMVAWQVLLVMANSVAVTVAERTEVAAMPLFLTVNVLTALLPRLTVM